MAGQAEQWFRLADQDGDGAVGGAEAVRFFTRSGLPQEVLGQVWELASGGGAKLNAAQFNSALRLVALAQASGGRLAPDQARLVVMGGGPQLPPPRLAGVTDTPPAPSIPTYTPQITGLTPQVTGSAPYSAQMTGGSVGYAPQATGGYAPPPGSMGYAAQPTGGPYMAPPVAAGATGLAAAASGPPSSGRAPLGPGMMAAGGPTGGVVPVQHPPGYAPPTPADLARYAAVFAATDADRDGLVRGSECFPVFMQSGLDKGLLKRMWDLVAGNAGALNRDQFVRAMFLMDGMRRGLPLPTVLPPGPWPQVVPGAAPLAAAGPTGSMMPPQQQQAAAGYGPPSSGGGMGPSGVAAAAGLTGGGAVAAAGLLPPQPPSSWGGAGAGAAAAAPLRQESWSLSSQFGAKGATKAISDAYDQTLPKIPDPPGKVSFEGKAAPDGGPSMAPDLDSTVASMLAPADKARWEAERAEALKKEQEQRQAEAEAANQKARLALFQEALSELVMYKSRVDVALLQASDSAARLTSEAEDLEARYHRAQLAAQSQAEAGSKTRKQLQDLLAKKQEAQNKLTLLQQELEMAQNLNPEELVALEREVGLLVSQVAAAEAKKAALDMQLDSGRKQKGLLADRISELDMAAAAGEGELRRAREELGQLQGKVVSAEASSLSPEELGEVKPLLAKAASAYRRLYSTAAAAGIEVPYEANLNNVGSLVWLEQLMAGAADWVDDDASLSGYSVVNALPDLEGVPPSLMRAAALAAAAQPAIKPVVVLGQQQKQQKQEAAADGAATAPDGGAGAAKEAAKEGAAQDGAAPAAAPADGADAAAAAAAGKADAAAAPAADGAAAAATTKEATATPAAAAAAEAPAPRAAAAEAGGGKASKKGAAAAAAAAGVAASAAAVAATAAAAAGAGRKGSGALGGSSGQKEQEQAAEAGAAQEAAAAADLPQSLAPALSAGAPAADGAAEAAPPAAAAAAPAAAPLSPAASAAAPAAPAAPAAAAPGAPSLLADSDSDTGELPGAPAVGAAAAAAAASPPQPPPVVPQGAAAADVPTSLGALAGFDPSMYRLPDHERQLTQQASIDSSYAGSFTEGSGGRGSMDLSGLGGLGGGAAAGGGATGASSSSGGLGSPAAGGAAAGASASAASPTVGFEDNAF